MLFPEIDRLVEKVGSKYLLVSAAAKRARQIKDGSPVTVEAKSHKAVGQSLEEIIQDKLQIELVAQDKEKDPIHLEPPK